MARIARPIFRRLDKNGEPMVYIAVRPIRLGAKVHIKPGEEVRVKMHQLRSLYQRRRIGPKGHPWTEQSLKHSGFPLPFITDTLKPDEPPKFEDQLPITTPEKTVITEDDLRRFVSDQAPELSYDDLSDEQKQQALGELIEFIEPPEPVKVGSQWGYPEITNEKFRSKKKAKAWYVEQQKEGSE